MDSTGYNQSATHAFMVALTRLTKPLPPLNEQGSSPLAKLQQVKKAGRTAVAQVVLPAWRLLMAWRQASEPLRFLHDRPLREDEVRLGYSRGMYGFCTNLQAGQCTTFGAALAAQRADRSLAAAFAEVDGLARQTAEINFQLTEDTLFSMMQEEISEAARSDANIVGQLRESAKALAAKRFGVGFRSEDYLMEEVGPAFGINAGFFFVALCHLKKSGFPANERISRACRIVCNSISFLRDWATLSTAAFHVLKQLQQFSSSRAKTLYGHGWNLSDPESYEIAQLGTEAEHLEFASGMTADRIVNAINRKIHEVHKDVYHIGCSGLAMRPSNSASTDNVVTDSLRWTCEIASAYGKYLHWDIQDF